jgi:hypothetical protein
MVSITHTFVSAKANGTDLTLVQPSNWNAVHTFTAAGSSVILGTNGSAGPVTEITCTNQGFVLLNQPDVPSIQANVFGVFTTGDVKLTCKTSADSGWIMMNDGNFGSATSGAVYANNNAQALFTVIYNNFTDADTPLLTSAGANTTRGAQGSAAAAWAANCRLALPAVLGRAMAIAGTGIGLTARTLGHPLGEETHVLTVGELAQHNHGVTDPGHSHTVGVSNAVFGSGNFAGAQMSGSTNTSNVVTGISIQNAGSNTAHNNMQPSQFFNVMIKL